MNILYDLTQCKYYTEFLMLRRVGKGFVGEEYGDAVSLGNGFYITKRNTAVEIQRKYLLLNEVFCLLSLFRFSFRMPQAD